MLKLVEQTLELKAEVNRVQLILNTIKLRGIFSIFQLHAGSFQEKPIILCSWQASDSLTGSDKSFRSAAWIKENDNVLHIVRDLVRETVLHELDEHLAVDGCLIFYPHKDQKSNSPFILDRSE